MFAKTCAEHSSTFWDIRPEYMNHELCRFVGHHFSSPPTPTSPLRPQKKKQKSEISDTRRLNGT